MSQSLRLTEAELAAIERKRFAQQGAAARWSDPESRTDKKPSKYRNEPIVIEGERFDSKGEFERYMELLMLQRGGEILSLRRQVPFALSVEGQLIGTYVADFVYVTIVAGRRTTYTVEDFKSPASKTPLYEWKRKHLLAEHGIAIFETGRA